jgi:hypothetical protein
LLRAASIVYASGISALKIAETGEQREFQYLKKRRSQKKGYPWVGGWKESRYGLGRHRETGQNDETC